MATPILVVDCHDDDGKYYQTRVFSRPDGGFTIAEYPSRDTPNERPSDKFEVSRPHAELIVKLKTGKSLDSEN